MKDEQEGRITPCDTIQTSNVEFNLEKTDRVLLKLAIEALGYKVNVSADATIKFTNQYDIDGEFRNGKLVTKMPSGREFDVNRLKRAYSEQVVNKVARQYGWKMKQKAPGKYQVQKGGF